MDRLHRDDGFTLSELVAALGLLGIILAATWAGFQASHTYSRLSDRQAWFAREVSSPLLQIERVMQQQYSIDPAYPGPTPYRVKVSTDADSDGNAEVWEIQATNDRRLVVTSSEFNTVTNSYDRRPMSYAWSTHNYNVQTGTPLFRFYDKAGNQITNMGDVPSKAIRVVVTVVTVYDGRQFSDSRTVLFRNY
ncbi:MAG: prepilin-type N-terminal cleavage/methylation domain-containing protein [Anaerosomatales bacterium]|nr:prepilin-type N-terminal cleavage/methylation domain-containing protein [Anaerosomatales bacterium]